VPYSWPWQIVLCLKSGWTGGKCSLECGGSIIDNAWVMTAAHCIEGSEHQPSKFKVRAGVFEHSDNTEPGEQFVNVAAIYKNPKYNHPEYAYDIALLKIDPPINFTDHIQPVCLPSSDTDVVKEGNSAWMTGWGATREGGSIPTKLHQVQIPFVSQQYCDSAYQGEVDDSTMFCAGEEPQGGLDTCQGDSGGPVVVQDGKGKWFCYGITSWGDGCAEPNEPGVYSRVASYCDFIKSTIGYTLCQAHA
jgi:secreted trypsin-like serine protease